MEQPISLRDRANKLVSFLFPKDEVTIRKETVEKAKDNFLKKYRQNNDEQIFGHALLVPDDEKRNSRAKVEEDASALLNKSIGNIKTIRFDWDHIMDDTTEPKTGENYPVISGQEYSQKMNQDYTDAATVFIVYK